MDMGPTLLTPLLEILCKAPVCLETRRHGTRGSFEEERKVQLYKMACMAPYAHLAMYKVCYGPGCREGDMLAGLDATVEDGMDVLSLSLGGLSLPFYDDVIAIAGNFGPFHESLSWILTVGASTTDRKLKSKAEMLNTYGTITEMRLLPRSLTLHQEDQAFQALEF
ncbi:hypothetical protein ACFX19_038594 [Malus domestica]